ncbi:O-antigen ligase family protein [Thermopirellula anaerolimosa]
MSRPRKDRRSQVSPGGKSPSAAMPAHDVSPASRESSQPWFLAAAVTLLAARPLFPSEGADRGDGLPVVMLWLALAVMWWLFRAGRPRIRFRFGPPDAAVVVLTLAYVASALTAVFRGTARPAVNMLWEAVGFALIFLYLRQFEWTTRRVRAILAVMVAVAVGLAAFGLYQYGVEMPAVRAAYRSDPARYLELAGLGEYLHQPDALRLLENRFFSVEPLATFALTNSLAGFLLPWGMVLLAAIGQTAAGAWRRAQLRGESQDSGKGATSAAPTSPRAVAILRAAVLAAAVFTLGLCLILTKSRAGYLAAVVGAVALAWSHRKALGRRIYFLLLAGFAALAVLIGLALALGGLDPLVFYEAGKSLLFRGQYWQATVQMILAHPWLGCGPGNFRYVYAQFRLPDAVEDISDPHNFLLEVWAVAGVFALAALIGLLAVFYLRIRRFGRLARHASTDESAAVSAPDASPGGDPRETRWWMLALVAAWPLGFTLSLLSSAPQTLSSVLVGLPVALVVYWAMGDWVRSPSGAGGASPGREAALCGLAAAVLLIHWSASGGWSFAGVAQSFWLLAAVGISWMEDAAGPSAPRVANDLREAPGPVAYAPAGVFALLTAACYATAYAPVLRCRALMEQVPRSDLDPRPALAALDAAARADPLAVEPLLRRLAVLSAAMAQGEEGSPPSFAPSAPDRKALQADLDRTADCLRRLAPNSDSAAFSVVLAYLQAADNAGDVSALRKAETAARRAMALQPSQVLYRARLADILFRQGRSAEAAREAETALRQDDAIANPERKLPEEWRNKMQILASRRLDNRRPSNSAPDD